MSTSLPTRPLMTMDMNRAKLNGTFLRPKDIGVNSQCPEGVGKTVFETQGARVIDEILWPSRESRRLCCYSRCLVITVKMREWEMVQE